MCLGYVRRKLNTQGGFLCSQILFVDAHGMIKAVEENSEEQHEEQAPLFVCCSGCQAVLKAGCKVRRNNHIF